MKCTIKQFDDFVKAKRLDLSVCDVRVRSKGTWSRVWNVGVTERGKRVYTLRTGNNCYLSCHKQHSIWVYPGKWKELTDITERHSVYTKEGFSKVHSIIKENIVDDFYDLEVEGEEYFTGDILSHNSTISQSIELAWFGSVNGKTQDDIVNRKNKHAEMISEIVTHDNDKVHLRRTVKPTSVELKVNGKGENTSKHKKYIEEELLDMNSDIFNNMLAPSLDDFKSFLSMSPGDKRKIIDKIFSLLVYNKVREVVREKIRSTETDINVSVKNLTYVKSSIEETKNEMDMLMESLNVKKGKNIDELVEKIEKINGNVGKIDGILEKIEDKETTIMEHYTELRDENQSLIYDIKTYKRNLELYKNDQCPECGSDLTSDTHQHKKSDIQNELDDAVEKNEKMKEEIGEIKEKIKKIESKKNSAQKKRIELTTVKRNIKEKIEELKETSDNTEELSSLTKIIEENEKKTKELKETVTKRKKWKKFLSIVEEVVSEKGAKSMVVSTIIPLINKYINEYLAYFKGFNFEVEFDSSFNSKIKTFNYEVSPKSLSSGESKIIDFCVLVTMVKILKVKYTNLNVLFLDEIFASLDLDNIDYVLSILKQISSDLKLNIFIIHQNSISEEYFDSILEITKENGFADIVYL